MTAPAANKANGVYPRPCQTSCLQSRQRDRRRNTPPIAAPPMLLVTTITTMTALCTVHGTLSLDDSFRSRSCLTATPAKGPCECHKTQ